MKMRYETAVPIGRGGVGEVYRVWDAALGRPVALKYLQRDDPELVERMKLEARAQARVEHPNVCRIYEVGEADGRHFISMQFIDGEPYDRVMGELDLEQNVRILEQVADAVQAAHAVGLVHRDLKPANILVERTDDGELFPYVVDFGIARELNATERMTETGQSVGTPGYMAPEQARGEQNIDRRADVFSLGVLLYEIVCGELPFRAGSVAEAYVAVLSEEAVPLRQRAPDAPADLETIAMRCLEKNRERRYPSARAVSDELRRYLDGEPIEARPQTRIERWIRRAARHRGVVATAVIALLATAGGAIKYTVDLQQERRVALAARADAEGLIEFMIQDLYDRLRDMGRLDLLEPVARRSLDYYARNRSGPVSDPDAEFRRGLTHQNAARVLEAQGEVAAALSAYRESRAVFAELVAQDARAEHLVQLATTWLLGGELVQKQGDLEGAVADYRTGLGILDRLIAEADAPADWRRLRARGRTNLGWALREFGQLEEARGGYRRAVEELEELVERDEEDTESRYQLSATLSDVAYLAIVEEDLLGAETHYRRALELSLGLARREPANRRWDYELVLLRGRLGYLEELRGRMAKALDEYRLGQDRAARLVQWDPGNAVWQREYAFCASSAGAVMLELGRPESALVEVERSLSISRDLRSREPDNPSAANDLAYDLAQVGFVLGELGREAEAQQRWEEALSIVLPTALETSAPYPKETAAGLLLSLGRLGEARSLIEQLQEQEWDAPELYSRAREAGLGAASETP